MLPLKIVKTIPFMLETPFFEKLEPKEVEQILHIMEVLKFEPEDLIFKEGDPGDSWYILYKGKVHALKHSANGDKVVNILVPRTCFGEMSILDGSPRSATIKAVEESTVFRFPRAAFFSQLDDNNIVAYKLALQMALVLAQRHRRLTDRLVATLQELEVTEVTTN